MDWIDVSKGLPNLDVPVLAWLRHYFPYAEEESKSIRFEFQVCKISSKHKEKWVYENPWLASGNYLIEAENMNCTVLRWTTPYLPFDLQMKYIF